MPVPVPSSLVRHLKEGRCVLFVGAGLSVAAGLPDWKCLLLAMVADIESEGLSDGTAEELRKLIDSGKLLDVADHCRQRLGERRYQELLGEQLRGGAGEIPDAHHAITQLPFSAVVTTNYDKLLERAYTRFRGDLPKVVTSRDRESLGSLLFSGGFFILKAHGDIDDAASLVLTARDYREIIHANPAFDALFAALLMTRSVLFIGYSLGDPDFRLLLDRQLSTFGENIPERYAVMSGVGTVEADVIRRSANIKVLPYPEGRHEEVLAFLRGLLTRLAPEVRNPPSVAPAPPLTKALEAPAPPELVPPAALPAPTVVRAETPTYVSNATALAPLDMEGVEIRLTPREDRLECLLRTNTAQSLHVSEPLSWSLFYRRLATLLQDRDRSRLLENYRRIGKRLADLLPQEPIAAIPLDRVVTLVLDRELADIPWELAVCDDKALAVARRVVRTVSGDTALAHGLPGIRQPVRALVIGDPGSHIQYQLPGAYEEALRIDALYRAGQAESVLLCRDFARLDAVVDALTANTYDVIHFAGHAWFDRHESYLAFDEGEVLTTSELRSLLGPRPPAILVLNSHYTAFLPRGMRPAEVAKGASETELPPTSHIGFTAMATAAGVGVFLGCFESPTDNGARRFGVGVHRSLLEGTTIAEAVYRSRAATLAEDPDDVTALQYVLSGHPGYRLRANH
jgi:CHAT domain-containing protein